MEHLQQSNFNNKIKNNNCMDKRNVKIKNDGISDAKHGLRDRGDTWPFKERLEPRNNKPNRDNNDTTKFGECKKFGKRDLNIHNDMTKSKNTLEFNNDASKIVEAEPRNQETKSKNPNISKIPSIKTVTDTDTTKTYKAVTFTAQKQQKAIQIKLPHFSSVKKTKIPKLINKYEVDKRSNVDDKIKKDKKFKHKREVTTPLRHQDGGSPPTEISKWTPYVTEYTKPYYEAWVNTTLAAMSNKNNKLYLERQNVLRSLQNSLHFRPKSPDLMYENFADERFTGKIKINR